MPHKIKRFFLKAAGWNIGEEIAIPQQQRPQHTLAHKISPPLSNRTTGKITSIIHSGQILTDYEKSLPQPWEVDTFRLKGLALLQKHTGLALGTCLDLVHSGLITSCSTQEHFSLEQTLVPFPGHKVCLHGSFARDPLNPKRSIPHTFNCEVHALPEEFLDPMQYIGFSLPPLASGGQCEVPLLAKEHFILRMMLFREYNSFFLEAMQAFLHAFFAKDVMHSLVTDLKKQPLGFLQLVHLHRSALTFSNTEREEKVLFSAPDHLKQELHWKKRWYCVTLASAMTNLRKEGAFEKKLAASRLRQKLRYSHEMQSLPMTKEALLERISDDFQEEITLYATEKYDNLCFV